jgi:hypothetical protein
VEKGDGSQLAALLVCYKPFIKRSIQMKTDQTKRLQSALIKLHPAEREPILMTIHDGAMRLIATGMSISSAIEYSTNAMLDLLEAWRPDAVEVEKTHAGIPERQDLP